MRAPVPCLVLASLWATVTPARAGVESTYGLGSRATALGGAYGALADDPSAVHYNPAGLALAPEHRDWPRRRGIDLHLGLLYAHPELWMKRGAVEGGRLVYDAPLDFEAAGEGVPHPIDDSVALTVGMNVDLGRLLGLEGLHLGVALVAPLLHTFRWDVMGAERPQWPEFTDRPHHLSVLASIAWGYRWVSFGVGLRAAIAVETNTEAVVGTTGTAIGNDVTLGSAVAPVLGLLVEPLPWLRVGLTYRGALFAEDHGYNDVDATSLGIGSFSYTHRLAHYYQPMELSAAVSVAPSACFLLAAELTFADWSEALDSTHDDHGGGLTKKTFTPRLGAEWVAHPSTRLQAGYHYVYAAWDNQGGPTNFVDNDRHVMSLGAQLDLARLLAPADPPLRLGVHAQLHVLRERREVKDWTHFASETEAEANPGWPGWLSGGYALNLGLSFDGVF